MAPGLLEGLRLSASHVAEDAGAQSRGRAGALLTAIFCAFAALLPIVSVMAPKGTVVLLLLAAMLAILTYRRAQGRFPIPDPRVSVVLVLLVVWCAIASFWSFDVTRSLWLALRIAMVFVAGMVLFAVAAALDDTARARIGRWLVAGFVVGLVLMAVETGLDYPLLRSARGADAAGGSVWFNRGAVAMALVVWPVTAYLWATRLGWKSLLIPVVLAIASVYFESAAATLGFIVGIATIPLVVSHRKIGCVITMATSVLVFVGMPFAVREMHDHGWHRADWLVDSARHRVEIWDFSLQRIAEKSLLGWGFDGSRHIAARYPDVSDFGWDIIPLHPHSAPLQIMLELGAVGAVLALALLWLLAVRLDALPLLHARTLAQALFVAAAAIGCVAFGLWQNWWLALIFSVALLVPLTAARPHAR